MGEVKRSKSAKINWRPKLVQYEDTNNIVKYIIGTSVSNEIKQYLLTCQNAKEMWDTLSQFFNNKIKEDLIYCTVNCFNIRRRKKTLSLYMQVNCRKSSMI